MFLAYCFVEVCCIGWLQEAWIVVFVVRGKDRLICFIDALLGLLDRDVFETGVADIYEEVLADLILNAQSTIRV